MPFTVSVSAFAFRLFGASHWRPYQPRIRSRACDSEIFSGNNDSGRNGSLTSSYPAPHVVQPAPSHSCLSATSGSARDARRAGRKLHTEPTAARTIAAPKNVVQSCGLMPKKSADTRRPPDITNGAPRRRPHSTNHSASRTTLHWTWPREAPRAIRMPNSDERRATAYDNSPNSPNPARPSASAPNHDARNMISRSSIAVREAVLLGSV
jgi:hypothetical protein